MSRKAMVVLVAGLVALGAVGGGIYYASDKNLSPSSKGSTSSVNSGLAVVHAAIVIDRSDSVAEDADFALVAGLVQRALEVEGAGKKSRIFVYATGDSSSGMEPLAVISIPIPTSHRVLEGREGVVKARESVIADVVLAVKRTHTASRVSAVYLAVKRALQQLRASGCQPDAALRCVLRIRTDGMETEEPWLKRSLRSGKMHSKDKPAPLDNASITIVFCGLAEVAGQPAIRSDKTINKKIVRARDARRVDNVESAWRAVFSAGENVTFEPFCLR